MDLPDRGLSLIQNKAKKLKIKGNIEISNRKNHRFMITLPDGKIIHFGIWKPKIGTYFDLAEVKNKDEILMGREWVEQRKRNWFSRHSKIMVQNDKGKMVQAIKYKYSPDYYSALLLW